MNQLRKPARRLLNAHEVFHSVVTDTDFEAHREEMPSSDAFARTALTLVELGTADSGMRTRAADQLHVAATIDDFVQAKVRFDSGNFHPSEPRALKHDMVSFNHALSQMIDNDPSANYREVLDFLNGLYRKLRSREADSHYTYVDARFQEILKGMTHEILFEQLAGHLGYEVEGTTIEDDLKGIDRNILIDGSREGVDVTATTRKANEKRDKDRRGKRLIIATNVPDEVIGCQFRLSPTDIVRYGALMEQELARDWRRVQIARHTAPSTQ